MQTRDQLQNIISLSRKREGWRTVKDENVRRAHIWKEVLWSSMDEESHWHCWRDRWATLVMLFSQSQYCFVPLTMLFVIALNENWMDECVWFAVESNSNSLFLRITYSTFNWTRKTWGVGEQQGRAECPEAVWRGDYKAELKCSGAEPQLEASG